MADNQELVEQASSIILKIDANANIIYFNSYAEQFFGYNREEVIGKKLIGTIIPETDSEGKDLTQIVKGIFDPNTTTEFWSYENENMRKNGERVWVTWRNTVFFDDNNEVSEILAVGIDSTEKRKHELEMESALHSRDKLFSIISHDLRAPISSLIGFSEMISLELSRGNYDTVQELIDLVKKTSEDSLALVENLLSWAMTQMDALDYSPAKVELDVLAMEEMKMAKSACQIKNIELSSSFDFNTNVYIDRNMLKTALRNLLSNAIKFTPESGNIRVEIRKIDNNICLGVKDSGIGMSDLQIENIIKRGYTKSTFGTSGEKGSGLGLMLTKELIEKNQGKLKVKSAEGNGTQVLIELPAAS